MTPEKLDEYINVLANHGWHIFWGIILLGLLIAAIKG